MLLQRSNFEIPARFIFQPYVAEWHLAQAETMEWVKEPKRLMAAMRAEDDIEKNWLRIHVEVPQMDGYSGMLGAMGLANRLSYTDEVNRTSIPLDVLKAHENYRNTPGISGRYFQVLICQRPEFRDGLWTPTPEKVTKNAWFMRDEFINLDADSVLSVQQFLNKWGIWGFGQLLVKGHDENLFPSTGALSQLANKQRIDKPGFIMVIPHSLKNQQERYRKAILPSNARQWLRSHPLQLDLFETAHEFPLFYLRRRYCTDAIDATITIDHLAKRQFGFCRRCHKAFQKETKHKKNYCSERCFNAAGVQRWREKQRNSTKKGAKRNAKG
jgi:hypothetical protein